MAVTSVLEGTVGSVTCYVCHHSVFQQSLRMRHTGLSRQLSYAPLDTLATTLVMRLLGPPRLKRRNNQHVGQAHRIKNTFPLQHEARTFLPYTRACHALQARMSVAPATVPVFGSLRLAFGDSEWPDSHFPKKVKYIAIQSASRDHFFFGASFDLAITTSQAKVS